MPLMICNQILLPAKDTILRQFSGFLRAKLAKEDIGMLFDLTMHTQ